MVQSVVLELTDGEDGVSGLGKKKSELDRNISKVWCPTPTVIDSACA